MAGAPCVTGETVEQGEVRLTYVSSPCADLSRALAEPLAGTAATVRTWLLIEQPGPWGVSALTQSHLAPDLGRALEAAAAGTGVRVALIRRPGRHADAGTRAVRRRVYAAHTLPGNAWLRTTVLTDPEALRDLNLAALGAGHHGGLWQQHAGAPLALVCTNGKRDRCCALLGRGLAAELAATGDAETWEITHIGGHRFAPTLLALPHGYVYGHTTALTIKSVLDALHDDRIVTDDCRGRSSWDRPSQAAELAVRALTGESGADTLTITSAERSTAAASWAVTVAHTDGRRWRATVAEDTSGPTVPASCGVAPAPQPRMTVTGAALLA